ncbi:carbohydrate ABC transporter permease [Breznakiella homolactica]|uniref:Carbohydrate ABC transporter permease n=1 Tax=Breznakiella homolactica TaxID=2798577 RepID=A0A7T7XRQ0_9SPIR|nr:carbohydrate ABC transporter permease [Breznakiella homolactica]QQO11243.1 carbohydrate ABC transporter permease [Breznakiella homolactica]
MLKKRNIPWQVITYLILLFMIFIAVFPSIWMLSTSIKQTTELYDIPPEIIPDEPTLANYVNVLSTPKMYMAFLNSVIVTFFVVVITLFLAVLAGYGLARYKFKGSRYVKIAMLLGQMVPGVVLIIPLYFLFTRLRLLDTLYALIIADLALTIPMGVVMLSAFFLTVPRELEEAAKIDGTTEIGALFRVVLPIAKPGIISVAIYTFIHAWEEFLFALNLTLSSRTRTLPIAISTFAGEFSVDWGSTMAAAAVVALPVLAIFLLCNRYFVQGLSEGAVKG